jgi:rhamnosyltransferase
MFKICAIVSSYYPNIDELETNILTYLPWVDHLIIWENTPNEVSELNRLVEKLNDQKLEIRTTGVNEYLAKPFNDCFKWAKEQGYSHVLAMDQDSKFDQHFPDFKNLISDNKDKSIAVFSSNTQVNESVLESTEVESAITSGSVFVVDYFCKLGMFNEDFLIDMIDVEYCLRARFNGFKVVRFNNIHLIHARGYATKSVFGITLNNYSALRTYYIIRNVILTWKLFPEYKSVWRATSAKEKFKFYKYNVGYRLLKLIFEDFRLLKCKAIFLGVVHGHTLRKGKYDL